MTLGVEDGRLAGCQHIDGGDALALASTHDRNKTTHDHLWGELCTVCGSVAGEMCRPGCKWEPCLGCGYPWWDGGCQCSFEDEMSDGEDNQPCDSDHYSRPPTPCGYCQDQGWEDREQEWEQIEECD